MIDAFLICQNEEEMIGHCLDSFVSVADLLGVLSIVDNGSTDDTLPIIQSYMQRLPIALQSEQRHSHHGDLRTLALAACRLSWIFYLDADETFSSDLRHWLLSTDLDRSDIWEFFKYTTILDRDHYVEGGNGPSQRMFRNLAGVHFPQNVHTEPTALGLSQKQIADGPLLFDHTACKSREALVAKGWRYQVHQGTVGIGPWHEYIGRVDNAHRLGLVREFEPSIRERIFAGPC